MASDPRPSDVRPHRAREQLLERYLPGLRAYIRLNVSPEVRAKESSSDLLQSVCRRVLERFDGFEYRGDQAFRVWLFRRALMTLIDKARYYRAEKRDVAREQSLNELGSRELHEIYQQVVTPIGGVILADEIERIERAFDQLSPEHREVITLAKIVGLSHAAIATEMRRTPKAVRNLLCRALARLSGILEPV